MITPISRSKDAIGTWLIDLAGNVAISLSGLALLGRIQALIIPAFASTEQALEWGSHLDHEQRATLLDIQRSMSNAAHVEANLQHRVNLATQSQLMREAAGAFPEVSSGTSSPIPGHAHKRGKLHSRN
jgi:hypothetical protein